MTLKLACADFTFPLLPHDNVLQLIAMLDLQGVDIGLFEQRSHLWPSREFENVTQSARQLKSKLDALNLQVADIFLQMNPDFHLYAINHPEAERRAHARDWFSKALDYAIESGAKHVTVLPGVHFTGESLGASLDRAVGELSWRVEQAQQRNIIFGVEAHVGSIVPDPASAEQLVKRVPGLTLTLDYTHFTRAGTPDAVIEPLIKYASHFHIRGARTGRLQESFARNTIDYRRVFNAVQASNYRGWLGIEYTWQDWEHCNECDNVSETILFRDFLRSLDA
ncbi:MAG: sugar phosphate isomerase/epimerase family protein [Caldilineaceae bacterium]